MDVKKANIEYYDTLEVPPPRKINPEDAEKVRRQVVERTGGLKTGSETMLELGCGTGWLGCSLGVSGFARRVVGLDISTGMLRAAASSAQLNGVDSAQAAADAAMLPFADESFDFLCGGGFLHHIEDEAMFFREARRVLKPGGMLLVFREPQEFGSRFVLGIVRSIVFIPGLFFRLFKRQKESFDHEMEKPYSHRQLEEFAASAGLEMVQCRSHSFMHTIHWQVTYKLKSFGPLHRFVQAFQPAADFMDEKILAHILPFKCFFEISACFRK